MGLMGVGIFGVDTIKESQLVSSASALSHVAAPSHVQLFPFQLVQLNNIKNFSDRPATFHILNSHLC